MATRLPINGLRAEYRGQRPAGEFTNTEGQHVAYPPKLKFELELPNGDVSVIAIGQGQIDRAAEFDAQELKKGDDVVLDLVVVVADDSDPESRSYYSVVTCKRADAKSLRAAA